MVEVVVGGVFGVVGTVEEDVAVIVVVGAFGVAILEGVQEDSKTKITVIKVKIRFISFLPLACIELFLYVARSRCYHISAWAS